MRSFLSGVGRRLTYSHDPWAPSTPVGSAASMNGDGIHSGPTLARGRVSAFDPSLWIDQDDRGLGIADVGPTPVTVLILGRGHCQRNRVSLSPPKWFVAADCKAVDAREKRMLHAASMRHRVIHLAITRPPADAPLNFASGELTGCVGLGPT